MISESHGSGQLPSQCNNCAGSGTARQKISAAGMVRCDARVAGLILKLCRTCCSTLAAPAPGGRSHSRHVLHVARDLCFSQQSPETLPVADLAIACYPKIAGHLPKFITKFNNTLDLYQLPCRFAFVTVLKYSPEAPSAL